MGYLKYDLTVKTVSWIIVLCYLVIIGIIFLRRMAKADKEFKPVRILYLSLALIFFFYIGNRIFFILSDFERDLHGTSPLHYQFVNIGYIFTELAFISLLYYGERFAIKKTKFILTYITIGIIVIEAVLVLNPEYFIIVRTLTYGLTYSLLALVLILFLRLTAQSTGKLRRNFLITVVGLIILSVGAILETDALLSSGAIPPYLTPILFAIGATIITLGLRMI
jgi:hypothetical protein